MNGQATMIETGKKFFPRGHRSGEAFRRHRGAFTIIELVVVCGIMALMLSVAVIAVKSMSRGNSRRQSVNLLTTMIANAHSWALRTHMPAGLVIYEDPQAKGESSVQVVVASTVTTPPAGVTYFVRAPNTGSQPLPLGIEVATLDDTSTLFKSTAINANVCRIILFDGNGQLVLHDGLTVDPSIPATDTSAAAWNLSGGSTGVSSPGLIVFNTNDLKAAEAAGATAGTWLQSNSDVLIVNAYTGNIIR